VSSRVWCDPTSRPGADDPIAERIVRRSEETTCRQGSPHVVIVRDLDASLRFYRDGMARGAGRRPSRATGRAVRRAQPQAARGLLGDRGPDDQAGVLELNLFEGDIGGPAATGPTTGFFLFRSSSTWSDAGTLADLGWAASREGRPTDPNGTVSLATVRDPDGLTILLTPARSPAHLTRGPRSRRYNEPASDGRRRTRAGCCHGSRRPAAAPGIEFDAEIGECTTQPQPAAKPTRRARPEHRHRS